MNAQDQTLSPVCLTDPTQLQSTGLLLLRGRSWDGGTSFAIYAHTLRIYDIQIYARKHPRNTRRTPVNQAISVGLFWFGRCMTTRSVSPHTAVSWPTALGLDAPPLLAALSALGWEAELLEEAAEEQKKED